MTTTTIQPTELPATIRAYLAAHQADETDEAARKFAKTAVIVDDGHIFRGTDGVRDFLEKASSEYTFTTTLVGARRIDDSHWVAINRVEGNFPGGVVVLSYDFILEEDLISELTISPQT